MSAVDSSTFRRRAVDRGIKESTFDQYVRWAKRFLKFCEKTDTPWESPGALYDFDAVLSEDPHRVVPERTDPYAYRTRVQALSGVKLYLERVEGVEVPDDVNSIVKGEPAPFDPYIYTEQQVEHALESDCSVEGCRWVRRLGYEAIMRAAEVVDVRPEDLAPEEGTVYVRAKKGSEPRHIGVSGHVLDGLREQRARVEDRFEDPASLFYNSTASNTWSANAWSQHFLRKHAPDVEGEQSGFHSFARHTAVTRRLEAGEDFGDVYLRARHTSPQMTSRYARIVGREAEGFTETFE